MQFKWLKRQENAKEVIIVFGGWAIGSSVFMHLEGEQDVLLLSDYRTLACNLPDLSVYKKHSVIAWSFGVAAFSHWQKTTDFIFDRKVALCGSPSPIDKALGIHPAIFKKTHSGLTLESYQGFRTRCFNKEVSHQEIDVEARREELLAVEARGSASETEWDKIIIAEEDKIFPVKNLERAFEKQVAKITKLKSAHVPFSHFKTWQEVLF